MDAPEDPFAGGINTDPGNFSTNFNGNASNHRRVLHGRGFRYAKVNLAERAAIADRSIDISEPVVWMKENDAAVKALST